MHGWIGFFFRNKANQRKPFILFILNISIFGELFAGDPIRGQPLSLLGFPISFIIGIIVFVLLKKNRSTQDSFDKKKNIIFNVIAAIFSIFIMIAVLSIFLFLFFGLA